MISFAPVEYDPSAPILLEEDPQNSDLRSLSRRVSRSQTLDGGVVLDDAGFADGDRTMDLRFRNVSEAEFAALRDMVSTYDVIKVGTPDGLFHGAVESLSLQRGLVIVRFLVESKASA